MKQKDLNLSIVSYGFMIVLLVILVFAYRYHVAGKQREMLFCFAGVCSLFGAILTTQTKLKWNEVRDKQ